ncbi:hypothetical protein [Nocardioides jensenii]|uniref:hypothetical protein n=1 Tax=Nocardioides jensenii TaxID=1843 RepID=UPI0012FAC30B|nr:hypothetical protein [Nocardioides jensenii]
MDTSQHAGRRHRPTTAWFFYAISAAAGAIWSLAHADRSTYWLLVGIPLASSAALALLAATFTIFTAMNRLDLIVKLVRLGRSATAVIDSAGNALAAFSAACGIAVALYATHLNGTHDTSALRAAAFSFAYMAAGVSLATNSVIARPMFSVVRGRPRTVAHILAAGTRVLIVVSLFTSITVLITPGTSAWITIAAGLLLTSIGWEVARHAGAEHAVRRFLEAATAVQSAATLPDGDLVGALAALENAGLTRARGRGLVVESEVMMIVRTCIERLDPHELRTYPPGTGMADLQKAFTQQDEEGLRDDIGRFVTSLRQAIVLRVPLVQGNIWNLPLPLSSEA